jgi:hypothetical protein
MHVAGLIIYSHRRFLRGPRLFQASGAATAAARLGRGVGTSTGSASAF